MRVIIFALLIMISIIGNAQSPKFDWVTHEGNGSVDAGYKIRRASNGDLYVAMLFRGSTSIGGITYTQLGASNTFDVLICKYNATGIFQWAKQVYASGNMTEPEMEIDGSDNIYIGLGYDGTLTFNTTAYYTSIPYTGPGANFIAKIDNSGNVIYAKMASQTWGVGGYMKMAVKNNGELFLIGYTADSVRINNVNYNTTGYTNGGLGMYYIDFNSNGTHNWHSLYETGTVYYKQLKFDANDQYIYGIGNISYSHTFVNNSSSTINTNGLNDVFLVKLQTFGFASCVWATSFGSSSDDRAEGLEIDANNNIYVLSSLSNNCTIGGMPTSISSPSVVLGKFNANGACSTVTPISSSINFAPFYCDEFKCDISNNIYASGYFGDSIILLGQTYSPHGSADALVIKIDGVTGLPSWAKQFGGSGFDDVKAIPNNNNEIYCTGQFQNTVSFGSFQYASNGSYDPYIAKLSGCDFPTVNITYNGNTTICNGQTITLNATALPGASYQWLKNSTPLASQSLDSLIIAGTGTYSVDIDLGGVCRDTFGGIHIASSTLNATIQSAKPSICSGGSMQLYTNLPYTSYNWSTGVSTPIATINQQGNYSVIVTDGSGCIDTATISVGQYPIPTVPSVLIGSNCQLASSVIISGYSYKWRLNGNIVGGNTAYLDANQYGNGFYTIEVMDINGCVATSPTPLNVSCVTGINDVVSLDDFKIFPNPNNGSFSISLTSDERNITITCTSLLGQIVYNKEYEIINGQLETALNLSSLMKGIYLLKLHGRKGESKYQKVSITD